MRVSPTCAVAAAVLAAATAAAAGAAPAAEPGAWTAPATVLQPPPRTYLGSPAIAVGGGGALVTWGYELANGHTGQRAAPWRANATLGPSHDLRTPIETPLRYKRDRAFALVHSSDGGARRLRVVFGSASGRFGAPRTIFTSRPDTWFTVARAAANARGDIAVLHRTVRHDGSHRIVLLERRAGGRFGAPQLVDDLPSCDRCASEPPPAAIAVALGPRGQLAVAWEEARSIFVRTRPAGGRLGPAVRLGPAALRGRCKRPCRRAARSG